MHSDRVTHPLPKCQTFISMPLPFCLVQEAAHHELNGEIKAKICH